MQLVAFIQKGGHTPHLVLRDCLVIKEVVRPAIKHIRDKFEDGNIKIMHSLGNTEFIALVDLELAKHVLINVLNNAIWAVKQNKHTTKKEVSIVVREEPNKPSVKIEIHDSGIGIDPSSFPNLFRPFFTTRDGGSGLGLFFRESWLSSLGGSLSIPRSRIGKGTTVVLSLPVKQWLKK